MSDPFNQLLDATIQHLQQLKARGVRFVSVEPNTLAGLKPAPSLSRKRVEIAKPDPRPPIKQVTRASRVTSVTADSTPVASLEPGLPRPSPAAPPPASGPKLNPEARAAAFADLRRRALECRKCANLASSRKNVVFGVGNLEARLMFVGEAPGADEDLRGEPFVGKAGELLTRIIQTMGLSRETVYIANILKCRPDTPGQASGNRKPTPEEMQTCIPYLHEQIDLIQPEVIVALGATAVEGLLGKTQGITRLRGQWQTYRGIPLMPTYHPAYLLRNQALAEKRRVWEDMLQVMGKLRLPISERQRNYFLKSA